MSHDNSIINRYEKETESASLGCANLWPFITLKEEMCILDLGCGRGMQTRELGQRLRGTGQVIGLDLTPAMVQNARAANNLTNVDFVVGTIEALPFADNIFDLIVSNCVINHARDKRKVYEEIFRTLKSGGKFIIGDVTSVEELPPSVADDPKAVADCWGGAIPKEPYLQIVREIGFKHIALEGSRVYPKNGFQLESIILRGEKA